MAGPGSPSRPTVVIDRDGAAAVAAAEAIDGRTAIWVGEPDDPELAEFEAEITRRSDRSDGNPRTEPPK